ncbi:MAG: phenylalanine--tRNA ligase subunit alpha [Candidatus Harrisonbacteria bacterium]|nr:phenylalanine--tRNA ligase subunit alpha [Candidatus Harrisonbacteria bacterium]
MDVLELKKNALREITEAKDAKTLESVRVKYLGRANGELVKILRGLKDLSDEEKRRVGPAANALRQELDAALDAKLSELTANRSTLNAGLDITMPGKKVALGHLHPLTLTENKIREIFAGLNFAVVEGPEVETEHYNFDALNIPANHPARDMWDTFWLRQDARKNADSNAEERGKRMLLRTHTSPVQIRYMETHEPPFQIIVPGRVFRFEAIDASHEINFHQVEGLMVGENVSLANFKYLILHFCKKLFGTDVKLRFRPSYFPFVEPGLEVDIQLQKGPWSGKWLEVMGAGMVHPKVFDAVKYNPKFVKGFAFGLGLERFAMIKYNIPDIRMFYENDMRFLRQF